MGATMKREGIPPCPKCGGQEIWRRGENSAGNQQWYCRTCPHTFVIEPYLKQDVKEIADRMIMENIPVPQIAVVLQGFVSRRWLYTRKGILNV